jgi:hypothetical protein
LASNKPRAGFGTNDLRQRQTNDRKWAHPLGAEPYLNSFSIDDLVFGDSDLTKPAGFELRQETLSRLTCRNSEECSGFSEGEKPLLKEKEAAGGNGCQDRSQRQKSQPDGQGRKRTPFI